jgi:hypothetical protein
MACFFAFQDIFKHLNAVTIHAFFQAIPLDLAVTLGIFFMMPFGAIIAAVISYSLGKPRRLLQILFGIEIPIISFTLARLVFLKTLTPSNILFLSTAAISISAYILYLFRKPTLNKLWLTIHTLALQAAVVVGLYASLLMFFFLPIVAALILQTLSQFLSFDLSHMFIYSENLWSVFISLTGFLAIFSLFLALISSPFVGLFLYWRAARRLAQKLKVVTSLNQERVTRIGFSLGYAVLVMVLAYQGTLFWFYRDMDDYRQATSFEARSAIAQRILKRKDLISTRLVKTYLSNYRYMTDAQMGLLKDGYKYQLSLSNDDATRVQNWFTTVAFPFVYQGKFEDDVKRAGEDYQQIFDEPIQIAESSKVRNILATSFNFSPDALKSSVLDRTDKDVKLVNKKVVVEPDSTKQFATVTIEEEYQNQTTQPQEVFYLFTLPQDAVITDLKLGPDLELKKDSLEQGKASAPITSPASPSAGTTATPPPAVVQQNQGEVAAKGAANQVYENQYARRIDPAILEQVGPTTYKLRIYPIPVQEELLNDWQRQQLTSDVRNQKMRFSYVTKVTRSGQVPLPIFTETRNIMVSRTLPVSLTIAGQSQSPVTYETEAVNLPLSLSNGSCGPLAQRYQTTNESTFFVTHPDNPLLAQRGITFSCGAGFANTEPLLKNKRIALLVDTSYSNEEKNWQSYLRQELPLDQLLDNTTVDLYYFNDKVSQPISLNKERNNSKIWKQISYGQTDRLNALKQVEGKYDAVIMFTDSSEADLSSKANATPTVTQPIYIVSKGGAGKFPDPLSTYLTVNEARIVLDGKQALNEFAAYLAVKEALSKVTKISPFILVTEAGTWVSIPNTTPIDESVNLAMLFKTSGVTATDPMAKIGTHRQIESQMRQSVTKLNTPVFLDSLNTQAQQAGIVSPFSSFIVLVTPEQKEQLRVALGADGRYRVNYDLGEEQLIQPQSGGLLGTSAVPEPHEWLLLFTGAGVLFFFGRRKIGELLAAYHA